MTIARRLAAIGVALLAACNEDVAAPGVCPQYCPAGSLTVIDTVLRTAISRDSGYGRPIGFVTPYGGASLLAASLPGRDSRPILRTGSLAPLAKLERRSIHPPKRRRHLVPGSVPGELRGQPVLGLVTGRKATPLGAQVGTLRNHRAARFGGQRNPRRLCG